MRYARYKIVVACSSVVSKESINRFFPSGGVHSIVLVLLVVDQLSWFLIEIYSCKRRRPHNYSLSLKTVTGLMSQLVGQKDKPRLRRSRCDCDRLRMDNLATFEWLALKFTLSGL